MLEQHGDAQLAKSQFDALAARAMKLKISGDRVLATVVDLPTDQRFGASRTARFVQATVTKQDTGGQYGENVISSQEKSEGWVGWMGEQTVFTDGSVRLTDPGPTPTPAPPGVINYAFSANSFETKR